MEKQVVSKGPWIKHNYGLPNTVSQHTQPYIHRGRVQTDTHLPKPYGNMYMDINKNQCCISVPLSIFLNTRLITRCDYHTDISQENLIHLLLAHHIRTYTISDGGRE